MHQLRWFVLVELQAFTYLVSADADCHSNCPEPKSHTDTTTNIGDRFSGNDCCGTLLREVDDFLQGMKRH